jgi:hypothetical protein
MGNAGFLSGLKRLERQVEYLPPTRAKVKISGVIRVVDDLGYTSTPLYAFMACKGTTALLE